MTDTKMLEAARACAIKYGLSNPLYGDDGGVLTTHNEAVETLATFASEQVRERTREIEQYLADHKCNGCVDLLRQRYGG